MESNGVVEHIECNAAAIFADSARFCIAFFAQYPIVTPPIKIPKLFPEKNLPYVLLPVLFVAALFGYILNGSVGGFDMETSYERRLNARDTFADSTLARYLFDNAFNGVLPFLAFIAGRNRSFTHFILAIVFSLSNFWLTGTKATFLYIAFMFFLGGFFLNGKQDKLPLYFLAAVTFLFIVALTEHFIAGRPIIADYIIRRMFMVGAQIQTYYFDAVFNDHNFPDTLLTDLNLTSTPGFFIGEKYFGNPLTNANTNAFFYAMALSGLPGLFLCILFVCVFFRLLDQNYAKTGSSNAIAIVSLYTLLLLEQAFTTAFISSGVLLCFLLTSLVQSPSRHA